MISVIVPAYREGEAILAWLQALFDAHPIEQCVVVDASDEVEVEAIREQANHLFSGAGMSYIAAKQTGRALQMNQGAETTTGSVLLFLHADTQLPEGALALIQGAIAQGWHWGHFDVSFDHPGWPYRMIAAMMNWRSRRSGIVTGDQAMFVSRAAFDLVDGFDEIELMEDIALSKKLKTIGPPRCLEASVLTSARHWQRKGVFRTIVLMWWLRLAYWLGVSPARIAAWYYT